MKGLKRVPSIQDLLGSYNRLSKKDKINEKSFALWSQWSRLDPRLAEIVTQRVAKDWDHLSPLLINRHLKLMAWPAAMGVLLEQARTYHIEKQQLSIFSKWIGCVMDGIEPDKFALFFFGVSAIGGKTMGLDAAQSHKSYRKWGFLGRAVLVNKFTDRNRTSMPKQARLLAIRELAQKQDRFSGSDYRQHLGFAVSIRQSELDLQGCKFLIPVGQTKGMIYRVNRRKLKRR